MVIGGAGIDAVGGAEVARSRPRCPVRFTGELSALAARDVSPWNRTWVKGGATGLAEAESAGEPLVPAALWNAGEGRVLAAAFGAAPGDVQRMAKLVERPPHDPRFRVTWETGPQLRVSIDAVDPGAATAGAAYLNGRDLTLDLSPAAGAASGAVQSVAVPQAGPGRYELVVPAPRSPMLAGVRVGGDAGQSGRVLGPVSRGGPVRSGVRRGGK